MSDRPGIRTRALRLIRQHTINLNMATSAYHVLATARIRPYSSEPKHLFVARKSKIDHYSYLVFSIKVDILNAPSETTSHVIHHLLSSPFCIC